MELTETARREPNATHEMVLRASLFFVVIKLAHVVLQWAESSADVQLNDC
jgi:hypothetical protein